MLVEVLFLGDSYEIAYLYQSSLAERNVHCPNPQTSFLKHRFLAYAIQPHILFTRFLLNQSLRSQWKEEIEVFSL